MDFKFYLKIDADLTWNISVELCQLKLHPKIFMSMYPPLKVKPVYEKNTFEIFKSLLQLVML